MSLVLLKFSLECVQLVETKEQWWLCSALNGHWVFTPFVWPSRIQRCIFIHVLTGFRKIGIP
jgi:hypothetical protein